MTSLSKSTQASAQSATGSGTKRLFVIIGVVAVTSLLSAFYAINEYSSGTASIVKNITSNSNRFETIYRDSAESKIKALRLGVTAIQDNTEMMNHFIQNDRPGLVNRAVPFFKEVLLAKHGIEQFNFWTPPAMLYLRASEPKSFGVDGTSFRNTIVEANKKRSEVGGMETGLGGLIALRAIVPILDGTRLVGVVELGDDISELLKRASSTSGLEFAVGLSLQRAEAVQKPADSSVDSIQGSDVFFVYSDNNAKQMVRSIRFDPRSNASQLIEAGHRTIYVRPFVLTNFSGVPTVVVATLFDLTSEFAVVFKSVAIKTTLFFLLSTIITLLSIFKFQRVQAILKGAISNQQKELEEKAAFCEAAVIKLRDVDLIKRGFFTNLVTAINEPLQAVAGTLQSTMPIIEASAKSSPTGAKLAERLRFAHSETSRLSRLIGDYQQIELFRQKLVSANSPLLALSSVVNQVLDTDMVHLRDLPQIKISTHFAPDVPVVRADPDLLRRMIAALLAYAARGAGHGSIALEINTDSAGWARLSITGTAYREAGAPSEALMDETRQFLQRLATEHAVLDNGATLIPLVLSRTIVEFYGGTIEASPFDKAEPGFVIRLPRAV